LLKQTNKDQAMCSCIPEIVRSMLNDLGLLIRELLLATNY